MSVNYLRNLPTFMLVATALLFSGCGSDGDDNNSPVPDTSSLTASNKATDADGNQYEVGWQTGGFQDPFVQKKNNTGAVLWKNVYETTDVDGRGVWVFLDGEKNPWVVFTVDGGSTSLEYINKKQIETGAFTNVYAGGYGSGGGPKVCVVAKLNPATGKIVKGTFLTARLSDGKSNGFGIRKIGMLNGRLAIEAETVAWPPGKGKTYTRLPNITDANRVNNVFPVYYELAVDLSEITEAILLPQ